MYCEYLEFAKDIAYKAGEVMLKYFNEDNGTSYKGDRTIVTKADKEINSYLISRVKDKYPMHSVDGEEERFGKSNTVWVCDPLVIDGNPKVGVIYDPFTDSMYCAIKGEGAYKNNKKISVNNFKLGDIRNVSHFDIWKDSRFQLKDVISELESKTYFVSLGSIARACTCVASGEFNLAIFPGKEHKNCDVAAAKVIVEEAGGKVTDLFGNEQRYDQDIEGAVISNGIIHDDVIDVIKKMKVELDG